MRSLTKFNIKKSIIFVVLSMLGIIIAYYVNNYRANYKSQAARDGLPPISGTFVSFYWSRQSNYTALDWDKEFEKMSAIGINKIIILGAYVEGYGSNEVLSFDSHMENVLRNADQRNMQVYMGPYDLKAHWETAEKTAKMEAKNKEYATILYNKYKTHKSFVGWYITSEPLLNDTYDNFSLITNITSHYKSLDPNLKVLAAPYFFAECKPDRFRCNGQWWSNLTPTEIGEQVKKFFQNTGIDIIAVQDGVGASKITIPELALFLPEMDKAAKSIGKEFWVDMETFKYNSNNTQFIVTSFAELLPQLDIENDYTIVSYIFYPYMYNNGSPTELYNQYFKYYITDKPVFTDVPANHWAFKFIKTLYDKRIIIGCSTQPMKFCPDNQVTRAESSIVLLKSKYGADFNPAVTRVKFRDVPKDYWAKNWINKLSDDGISSGCGDKIFCPDKVLTRSEAVILLLKTRYGASYTPPLVQVSKFSDVPSNYWALAWIEAASSLGITSGCGNGKFCGDNPITRAEMAVMTVKTFGF